MSDGKSTKVALEYFTSLQERWMSVEQETTACGDVWYLPNLLGNRSKCDYASPLFYTSMAVALDNRSVLNGNPARSPLSRQRPDDVSRARPQKALGSFSIHYEKEKGEMNAERQCRSGHIVEVALASRAPACAGPTALTLCCHLRQYESTAERFKCQYDRVIVHETNRKKIKHEVGTFASKPGVEVEQAR
ncbi:hypothetical protein EVAR_47501_1 [Eumeta japonica]|uniref:Uncharacterized protein n=1 Tax=Eumeta variegata TaxID=151549 RepID=A0A4C1XQ71_EUMVA|nr:hypothetical protein EVAR_47501_1 [Eumeta japonica]